MAAKIWSSKGRVTNEHVSGYTKEAQKGSSKTIPATDRVKPGNVASYPRNRNMGKKTKGNNYMIKDRVRSSNAK